MTKLAKWTKPDGSETRIYVNGGNRKIFFYRDATGLHMKDPAAWQKSKQQKYVRGEKDNEFAYAVLKEHGIIDDACKNCWTAEVADKLFAAVN